MVTTVQKVGHRVQEPPEGSVLSLLELGTDRTFSLHMPRMRIGRDFKNEIMIHTDLYVSRFHAYITYEHDSYWVADLGSKNGTRLNGAQILDREQLKSGDLLTVGRTDFQVV